MSQDEQSKLAVKKLRAYLKRGQRAVGCAHETNPHMSPCQDTAWELKIIKMWLNDGINEIKTNGIDSWLKSI